SRTPRDGASLRAAGGEAAAQRAPGAAGVSHVDAADVENLAAQARSFPPLSASQVEQLLADVRGGDGRAPLQRLVEHHLGLVFDEARTRADRSVEVFDLYQEGTLAALVAI